MEKHYLEKGKKKELVLFREIKSKTVFVIGTVTAILLLAGAYSKPVFTGIDLSRTEIPEPTEAVYYSATKKAEILSKFASASADEIQFAEEATGKLYHFTVDSAGQFISDIKSAENNYSSGSSPSDTVKANGIDELSPASAAFCPDGFEAADLIRVCDGDTIYVCIRQDMGSQDSVSHLGEEVYVRLIGINTPESGAAERIGYHDSTDAGEMASHYTKELLDGVDTVWLSRDRSDTDKYGRCLRYVWIEEPVAGDTENINAVKEKTLNCRLLMNGQAETLFLDDRKYESLFTGLKNEAKEKEIGLWQYEGSFD